ncbi:CDP-glucose 4,6-dehydratase [Paenibacillus alkalitolerans]|uniref:CDP-glucose 4,6-dehydratase n=1 Tax=Paenibacillus alkalitolerans TaxID=2799335 RepID=UPI0018F46014|nr:CDP-glucose 4,6-dehydratase [Paenibacillus alkalitolerans]
MIMKSFWENKKIFITGHTGFKGSWLCLFLVSLGADVTGYSLPSPTKPSLYELCQIDSIVHSVLGDVRSKEKLQQALIDAQPDIVIHMAAQPLVRVSYQMPVESYEINVMGTVHLLEAVRNAVSNGIPIKAVINVTSDKCYENKEWVWGYREQDELGGYDPYSSSKACSELVMAAYRNSYFHTNEFYKHGVGLATARAGNVIGGGDWAADRLVPDFIRALLRGEKLIIRNPGSIRPWQHVLEPLGGYLLLAQKLYEDGRRFSQSWNFGPNDDDAKSVEWIVRRLCEKWGENAAYEIASEQSRHEAHYLKLDCSKAKSELGWRPTWDIDQTLDRIIEWIQVFRKREDVRAFCLAQIEQYYLAGVNCSMNENSERRWN